MKKIISAALATLMAVSAFSTSAFAAGLKGDATLDVTSTVNVPTVDVSVPTSAAFVINPYKLKVVDENGTWVGTSGKTNTVVPLYPKSGTEGWTVSNNNTTNGVDVYMYATYKAGKNVEVNATTATAGKKQLKLALKFDTASVDLLATAPTSWKNDEGTAAAEGVAKVTFAKADSESSPTSKQIKFDSLDTNTKAELDVSNPWTEADTCTISMAFKFEILAVQ